MPDQAEHRIEIDGESRAPLLGAHLLDGNILRRPDAVIGDENIEAPEMLDDFSHQRAGRIGIIQLGGECVTVMAAFFGESFRLRLGLLITERDLRARRAEHTNRGRANSARAASDESYFAGER